MKYLLSNVLVLAVLAVPAIAQDAEPAPAEKYAGQITSATELSGNLKAELTRITDEAKALQKDGSVPEEAVTDDLAKAKEYYDGITAKLDQAVGAWNKGDDSEAKKLNEEAHASLRKKDIFQQRMFEFR